MISLTQHQSDLLNFLKLSIAENAGVAPTYDEMREAVGLASKSGINRLIVALEERGLIRRLPGRARAIEIIEHRDLQNVSDKAMAAELEARGWHCLPPLRLGNVTATPRLTLPEPPSEPPIKSGSGPSLHSTVHISEATCG